MYTRTIIIICIGWQVGDVAAMSRQLEERQAAAKAAAGERHRIEGSLGTYHESLARCRRWAPLHESFYDLILQENQQ